jgi:mono/diheme cytochrome c family protein
MHWNDMTLGQLFEEISSSMPMNAPGSLSGQQNADVLAYILSVSKFPAGASELPTTTDTLGGIKYAAPTGGASAAPAGGATAMQGPKTQWDGVYTDAQAKRGAALYTQHCEPCHGSSLEGSDLAPPLTGGPFDSHWNDMALFELFERMRTSMPANAPGSLSPQENVDVLAHLLATSKFPTGSAELAATPDARGAIKYMATKPAGH